MFEFAYILEHYSSGGVLEDNTTSIDASKSVYICPNLWVLHMSFGEMNPDLYKCV
jgi:hypothetical protein